VRRRCYTEYLGTTYKTCELQCCWSQANCAYSTLQLACEEKEVQQSYHYHYGNVVNMEFPIWPTPKLVPTLCVLRYQ